VRARISQVLLLVLMTGVIIGSLSDKAFAQPKKIGILLWSGEDRYVESTWAMLEQLKADGFGDLEVRQESAEANKAIAMRLAKGFAAQKMDVYVGVGTNGVAALQKEISNIPIVFNVVYDPMGAGFVDTWKHSKNNITGVSNLLPMTDILQRLKTFVPLKNLAVLYTPDQKNSEAQLQDLQDVAQDCSIKIIPVPLSSADDAALVIPLLKGKAEAIYLTGSGFVGSSVGAIVKGAVKEKMVPISHLSDYVDQGVLLAAGADMRELGRMAAGKVEEVLKGVFPTDIPVEGPKRALYYLNLKTAKAMGIIVPDDLKKEAVKVIE